MRVMSQQDDAAFSFNTRLLTLEPGMYILRYASQLPDKEVCLISLQQAPLGKGTIDFFPGETVVRNTLARLGDCIVARVKNGLSTLLVTEYQSKTNSITHTVDLRIDRIDTSAAIMRTEKSPAINCDVNLILPNAANADVPLSQVLPLFGYIETLGEVSSCEWLGSASEVAGINGFAIFWPNKPQGVDIAYSCAYGDTKMPTVLSGNFVGCCDRSTDPITSITMTLVGPQSNRFKLDAQVAFANEKLRTLQSGQEVSASQRQSKLVAIRVTIVPSSEINAARYTSPWDKETPAKTICT